MDKDRLNKILMKKEVCASIEENFEEVVALVPEIKPMIGFKHNHPHHHLDVWDHTMLALSLSPNDLKIRLALLLHDIGKPKSYQDVDGIRHFKNHPYVSYCIAKKILTRLNYNDEEIEEICELIKNHDNLITSSDIKNSIELSAKRFKVQVCDALAHHPQKLEKRIKYLKLINEKLNKGETKKYYDEYLNKINNKVI